MTDIEKFKGELQSFLAERHASMFFGEHHAEVYVEGERIGAVTHEDGDAVLVLFECDC